MILFINACVRDNSRTLELAKCLLSKLEGPVEQVDLSESTCPALDKNALQQRTQAAAAGDYSLPIFSYARQFARADTVVIAAPYWDLMFPAVLKCYLESICVSGLTFSYSDAGIPVGLCKAEKLYYVTTAGGFIGNNDFGFRYVQSLARELLGIRQAECIRAEGLDISPELTEHTMLQAKKSILASQPAATIPYPEKYAAEAQKNGATAFMGSTDHTHSRYYVQNDFFNMKSDASLHILSQFKTYQQTTEYTCGAACALMVLNWFGKEKYHEVALANLLETHCTRGSSVENMADLFDLIGWNVDFHAQPKPRFDTMEQAESYLLQLLDRGIPVMVDWVDWAGHWQVLIGIDTCGTDSAYDDVLIFADPYDVTDHAQDGYYTYPLGRFFGMWREGPCTEKAQPYIQPFVAAWPKES